MNPILIIGGGISGITSAVEAAEAGFPVILIEQKPYLGGQAIGMNRYFPKMCPPYCGMEINFRRIKDNPLITYYVSTIVQKIEAKDPGYLVKLESEPAFVNNNCTLCGECSSACPVDYPDPFNQNMGKIKAIDNLHTMSFPERYYLNQDYCQKENCSSCADVCKYDAINLKAECQITEIEVRSIIVATGWENLEPKELPEYSYSEHTDIITQLEMERRSALNGPDSGSILCQSSGKSPQKIAFVQCAGSRDENHLPYCSGVCCSASLKQALHAVEVLKDVEVSIHYIDIRVRGRNEDFLRKVEDHPRIKLIKGKVTGVKPGSGDSELELTAEHIESGKKLSTRITIIHGCDRSPQEYLYGRLCHSAYGCFSKYKKCHRSSNSSN